LQQFSNFKNFNQIKRFRPAQSAIQKTFILQIKLLGGLERPRCNL